MKKAIFTLAIGDNPMYKAAVESFEAYGEKVGADVIVSDELHYKLKVNNKKYDASPAWSEKLYMAELLKKYDRILYIDADMIIAPWAENIFEEYSSLNTVYMFNEGCYKNRTEHAKKINSILGEVDWPIESNEMVYFNSGMILVSKEANLFKNASAEEMQKVCNEVKFYDQTYINYLIFRDKIDYVCIDKKFNRMPLLGLDGYKDASFIHYAGRGYREKIPMRELKYIIDYCDFFAETLSEEEILKYKQQSWHWYMLKQQRKTKLPIALLSAVFGLFHPQHKY
ncbi:glycosyltransferase [Shewanella donghaensis]|uniref:glycosyltransferase n=1 Tax=Shewanella donghaensis TaxID=238836 RepID=UPI001183C6CF|nr:glycosyltransferase [Shewanella donghaensis]